MKIKTVIAVFLAVLTFFAPSGAAPSNPYTLKARPGEVSIVPHGGWHVNEEFPWDVQTADGKHHRFFLSWNLAMAKDLPPGEATGKGGVCSSNTCVTFSFKVKVP